MWPPFEVDFRNRPSGFFLYIKDFINYLFTIEHDDCGKYISFFFLLLLSFSKTHQDYSFGRVFECFEPSLDCELSFGPYASVLFFAHNSLVSKYS